MGGDAGQRQRLLSLSSSQREEATEQIIGDYASVLSSVLSVAALGLILRLSFQIRVSYNERISSAQERNLVLEERLRLAEDRLDQLRAVDSKVTAVGAALGLEDFKEQLRQGVSIRDIGDNFSGKIAGGDLIETLNRLGNEITDYRQVLDNRQQQVGKVVGDSAELASQVAEFCRSVLNQIRIEGGPSEYRIEMLFDRKPEVLTASLNALIRRFVESPWRFHTIVPAYQALDGCAVIFRRPLTREEST